MSMHAMRIPVCVFAKPPIAGDAKTRLARYVGPAAAARLARAFFDDTWAMVRALSWARPILATTDSDVSPFDLSGDVEIWQQGPGDLGARMERVLSRAVDESGRAIVIGADVPGLPAAHLDAARLALAHHDVVIGPAADGGFYLLGTSRVPPGALSDLRWSSSDTRVRTERRLRGMGLSLTHAPAWFDVDEPEDVVRVRRLLLREPHRAPHTLAALNGLRRAG